MSAHAIDIREYRDSTFVLAAHGYSRHTSDLSISKGALPDSNITIGTGYILRVSATQQTNQHSHNFMGNSNEAGAPPKFLVESNTFCLDINKKNVFEFRKAQRVGMVGDEPDAIA